ncbi:hypothetical protein TREMEDRAFT_27528 [Tremella mesenterica DSM 1558]|uniref:uncharacterized protein n=1 Tax=Tremella mesenterica (strain ATCC 24925 / CBS 8224 / DSM 1558 / NBRC 9311 / NRRL Y-6157 / RJB 2259-6 / UBC 559-6) TaxID=578456 RepID=UPI0003F4A52B|nr:uncharacterized protein TREMEDRAFT_27528 [Tremella mesenterica DSM 1558]EIW71347.1 hypothetical protein TREMEDRAFT_27528 [Tremella mesenterica DSM 1558]
MSSIFSSLSTKSSASSSRASSIKEQAPAPPETSEVIVTPPEESKPKKKWEYTPDQLQKVCSFTLYTKTLLLPESDSYYLWEKRFLDDPGCHPRYCRAAKWKMDDAKKRIKGTIEWRREYKPELMQPGDVKVEAETGKIILKGFDMDGRPVLYLRPGRENTETSPRQIRHMIYHLERAIDLCPPGQDQVTIIVDYKSATSSTMPSIGKGRSVLNILQNHYVERLGRGLVVNMPWWVNAFFTGISPFLDPITRDKIRFNPKLTELVPPSQLDYEFGGEHNFVFDHDIYWKTLTEFCCLAEDGTRIDKEGKSWIPPLGNGIAAALEGYAPTPDAVASGQMTKSPQATAGIVDKVDPSTSEAQTIVAEHRAKEPEEKKEQGISELQDKVEALTMEVPAVETAPGPPTGEVVFDHPPSGKELAAI